VDFSLFLIKISPAKALIKAPIIMPEGGKSQSPMSIPAIEISTPSFVAPYFFLLHLGTRKSSIVTETAIAPNDAYNIYGTAVTACSGNESYQ
jgi:hypothetical protein